MTERITELTLYPPIINYLSKLGFTGISQVDIGRKYPDIEFWLDSEKVILELKIGEPLKLLKGVVQANEYASKVGTRNTIIVVYPPEIRHPLIREVETIALDTEVLALVLTDYWKEGFIDETITVRELLGRFKERIEKKERVISFSTIIKTLREGIEKLSGIIRSLSDVQRAKIVNTVVGRFDLFLAIGESTKAKKEELKLAAIDLASYLLVNQILFYHIYREKTKNVSPLPARATIDDLIEKFNEITEINYKVIYSVDILSALPKTPEVNEAIQDIVTAIKWLEPESIRHDLYGRLFHELLPPQTRKILAAFYTRPSAAEILATLTIDSANEKVADFACGSGTLLVSAYRRKLKLLKEVEQTKLAEILAHTTFVEEEITGIDILPFAAHLSAVNLAAQNLGVTTNRVRVSTGNSLYFRPGHIVQPLKRVIQIKFIEESEVVREESVVSPQGSGEAFTLEKVDCVIMNPPFTDKEKMPDDLKKKLGESPLRDICGGAINYWGYFVALADKFLDSGGKIGFVIPISIFKGRDTEILRKYLIENYKIRYIVKAVKNIAFTEGAAFRDVLLIAEKGEPKDDDLTGIIFLKRRLDGMGVDEARKIAEDIRNVALGMCVYSDDYDIYWVRHDEIKKHSQHMMPLVAFQDVLNRKVVVDFIKECLSKGKKKLRKIKKNEVLEGFHTSPKGLSQITFVTRPLDKSRLKKAFLVLEKEENERLDLSVAKGAAKINVEKRHFIPALRTGTGVKTIDITGKCDYIAVEEYEEFETVKLYSKWSGHIGWDGIKRGVNDKIASLAFIRRINPYSPNTHLLAFYSDTPFVPSDLLKKIDINGEEAKAQSILLNSTFFLSQVFLYKEEATGTYPDVRRDDLVNMYVFDYGKLLEGEKEVILDTFEKIRNVEFPSLEEQLRSGFWGRKEIDRVVMEVIGFSENEIESWLNKVYSAIVKEMEDFENLCEY